MGNQQFDVRCPRCGVTASSDAQIEEKFGYRKMDKGVVRKQSWCRKCRSSRNKKGEFSIPANN